MTNKKYPKVGFAFSGASSRSIFYIGFLEVLEEHQFPVDFIAAMSGAAVVAASYACGTMESFKQLAFDLDKEVIFSLIERSKGKGGMYHLDKVEDMLRLYTKNNNFEDVHPRMGFIATDITEGEEVVLQVGDIAKAVTASCTLPGIFDPMPWGNRKLIDGGIMNIVPGNVARQAGVDVVIGIDMRATRFVFSKWQIMLKRILNGIKRIIWPNQAEQLWQRVSGFLDYSDFFNAYPKVSDLEGKEKQPNLFSVLGRSLDLAIEAQAKHKGDVDFECDMLITPEIPTPPFWKRFLFLHFTDFSNTHEYYRAGRVTAQRNMPKLWKLLAEIEQKEVEKTAIIKNLMNKE